MNALHIVTREEAAARLGINRLDSATAVEQAAETLRHEHGWPAVAITGDDGSDYAATPEASGWLTGPAEPAAQRAGTHAASMQGFVAIETLVLGKMAAARALWPQTPAIDHLPGFSLPGQAPSPPPFAPLADKELGLYAVVDSAAWLQRVLAGGVRTVQLRIKDARHPTLREEVRASVAAARAAGAQLFVNDHWRVALEEGAYGVHLGQEDLATADLGAIARAGVRLGVSTHAYWEVCRAWALRPSYIACGPIHPTQAKAMPWVPQGNGNLAYWCALLPCPVVAIAGMDAVRAEQAMQAGAAGVAVISAITAAAAPEEAIRRLQEAVQRGTAARETERPAVPPLPRPTLRPAGTAEG